MDGVTSRSKFVVLHACVVTQLCLKGSFMNYKKNCEQSACLKFCHYLLIHPFTPFPCLHIHPSGLSAHPPPIHPSIYPAYTFILLPICISTTYTFILLLACTCTTYTFILLSLHIYLLCLHLHPQPSTFTLGQPLYPLCLYQHTIYF